MRSLRSIHRARCVWTNLDNGFSAPPTTLQPRRTDSVIAIEYMKMSRALKFLLALLVARACCSGETPSFWVVGWGSDPSEHAKSTTVDTLAARTLIVGGRPLTNVTALAAGDQHGLALKPTGEVVGWGFDAYGQISGLAKLSNVVAIA